MSRTLAAPYGLLIDGDRRRRGRWAARDIDIDIQSHAAPLFIYAQTALPDGCIVEADVGRTAVQREAEAARASRHPEHRLMISSRCRVGGANGRRDWHRVRARHVNARLIT